MKDVADSDPSRARVHTAPEGRAGGPVTPLDSGTGRSGARARSGSAAPAGVSTKSTPTDVVTASDTALEALVRERLAQLRPGDPVVGEEGGGTAVDGVVTWVVDPIDGTVNFLYGLPWYAVSLAATRDGVSLAGAVAEPASGRLWSAARGAGATCDGRPLRSSAGPTSP